MLIDNRTNKKSDLNKAIAITVIGSAREELNENDYLKLLFLTRYPTLKQFLNDPDNALIVVNVQEYIIAGFNKTQRIVINLE